MKTNKLLRYLFLCFSFMAATVISAQTLVTEWEAEDYILNGFSGGGGSEPGIQKTAAFSGGKGVKGISKSNVILQNFCVPTAGTYELKIYYSYTADQSAVQGGYITTRVNSQIKNTVAPKLIPQGAAVGDVIQVYSILIYCEAGWNTLKIGQNTPLDFYTPYIDKCEVYTTETTITKPDDDPTAMLSTLYPESFTTKNVMYDWDFTDRVESIALTEGTNATLANLTDNDLSTSFISTEDSVKILVTFTDSVVVKHLAMGGLLKLGTFKLEYLEGGEWKVLERKSAYSYFVDGALWYDTKAATIASFTNYKLTLYKAPGATQIEVADVLFHGYLYTKDLINGTGTYAYMKDDITTDINGAWVGASKAADTYNGLTGFQTLDNARTSKYSVNSNTFQIVYKFNYSANVTSFILSNASGTTRNAKTWEIQGSNDSTVWTILYRTENLYWKGTYLNYGGVIVSPGDYMYYRFDLQSNNGDGSYSEIGDILLFGEVDNGPITKLENPNKLSVLVYGTVDKIVIKGNDTVSFQVMDITGKIVKQGNFKNEISIPMTKGLYLVKLNGSTSSVTKIIVK